MVSICSLPRYAQCEKCRRFLSQTISSHRPACCNRRSILSTMVNSSQNSGGLCSCCASWHVVVHASSHHISPCVASCHHSCIMVYIFEPVMMQSQMPSKTVQLRSSPQVAECEHRHALHHESCPQDVLMRPCLQYS